MWVQDEIKDKVKAVSGLNRPSTEFLNNGTPLTSSLLKHFLCLNVINCQPQTKSHIQKTI